MNRILFFAVLLISFLWSSTTDAQWIAYHFATDNGSLTSNVPLNEISTRAFRNFIRSYGYIPVTVWRKGDHGYSASFFTSDSALCIIHYSLNGRPSNANVYYTDTNTPPNIRSNMNSLYSGDKIVFVNLCNDGSDTYSEIGLAENGGIRIVEEKDGIVKTTEFIYGYVAISR